ncbi:hypothetical protein ACFOED_08650 [Vulcaniibacterium thermophilum]|uniref:Sulfotransferase family protein n=2 Tax=Gammaproteobacteria TaxID=1236 RepID=A0A918Z9J0_9GAMM|nr:hypothetical protein [Vulcaniibacterium thermophilum]GHE41232.1 sulfotransferase family protein [Vulcaniibacterium thermophilum]
MQSACQPDAVLVLGMHRSGTSAATGALERLGLHLGDRLVPAAEDNPSGYFEHADAVALNEALLDAMDRSWDDIRALPDGWLALPAADAARARIRTDMLPALSANAPWALKDPRLCRLLPLWRIVLEESGVRVAALLVVRHPDEVSASLLARDRMPPTISRILWLRHVFESVRSSVGLPRAVLNYAALLEAPTSLLSAVGERLGLQLPATAPQMALDEFLKRDARHHAACNDPPPTDEWHALSLRTYSELTAIEPDWRRMDGLYQEFCRLQQQAANWIELTGAVLRAADVRRRSLAERALAREAQLDVALQTVTAQALERLETMRALRADLDATQIALEQVKAQALERLETMRGLRLQLDATEEALTRVESLSLERLAGLERVSREYAEATQALERAEAKRAEVEATLVRVSERLARIETSWWWKAAQSVRRLLRRGG